MVFDGHLCLRRNWRLFFKQVNLFFKADESIYARFSASARDGMTEFASVCGRIIYEYVVSGRFQESDTLVTAGLGKV